MSNKELCISIIENLDEDHLAKVAVMLQSVKDMLDEALDDAFCLRLYNDYLYDTDPEKQDTVSLHDYAKELGIALT